MIPALFSYFLGIHYLFFSTNHCQTNLELLKTKASIAQLSAKDQTIREEIYASLKRKDSWRLSEALEHYWHEMDSSNTSEVKKIIAKWGWPSRKLFGKKYCDQLWLLVQHSDHDHSFQVEVLKYLREIINSEPSQKIYYSYLFDRIKINEHMPQSYGTQGHCVKHCQWTPFEIEDCTHLDERRREMGLGPFGKYKQEMNEICC